MKLDFQGGVAFGRKNGGRFVHEIDEYNDCSAVCFKLKPGAEVELRTDAGEKVRRGNLLAVVDGTPVHSSVSGVFNGKAQISGSDYLVVTSDGKLEETKLYSPESRAITDISGSELITLARRYGIYDTRSGKKLWRMLDAAENGSKRVVIDCTESDFSATISTSLCRQYAKDIVFGAKMLIHTVGASKCVFALTENQKSALDALSKEAEDKKLFAFGILKEKYPIGDRGLVAALYLKELAYGETAAENGYFIVGAETAKAFYDSVKRGKPQLDRYISVCGKGFGEEKNLKVPFGITLHDVVDICGGLKKGYLPIENDLFSGEKAYGALGAGVRTLIAVRPKNNKSFECVFCYECVRVCPMKLYPLRAITGEVDETLYRNCNECNACEYICPSGIPLASIINSRDISEVDEDDDEDTGVTTV